jgi:hypothetical protein
LHWYKKKFKTPFSLQVNFLVIGQYVCDSVMLIRHQRDNEVPTQELVPFEFWQTMKPLCSDSKVPFEETV